MSMKTYSFQLINPTNHQPSQSLSSSASQLSQSSHEFNSNISSDSQASSSPTLSPIYALIEEMLQANQAEIELEESLNQQEGSVSKYQGINLQPVLLNSSKNQIINTNLNLSSNEVQDQNSFLENPVNKSSMKQERSQSYLDSFNHIGNYQFSNITLLSIAFLWDTDYISTNLELSEDERTCTSKTSLHSFKSCYGNELLIPGFRYYYEIKFLKGSNFKVGVSRSKRHLEIAFSDTEDGWAYYSNGQLRHNSKGDGEKYGSIFRGKDTIGVYVDLIEGIIFYSKNGKIFKDAYKDEELTKQPLYPACSCLTKGESFELLFPACED